MEQYGTVKEKYKRPTFQDLTALWLAIYGQSTSHSVVKHLPIFGYHAPIILETLAPVNNNYYYSFKFKAKWLLDKEVLVLVNSIWSNYIKGFHMLINL